MDDSSGGSSVAQTLANVFTAGLGAYVDSQNNQPVYVQQPLPQTAYGYSGTTQATPGAGSVLGLSPVVLLGGIAAVVLAVVLLKK